MQRRAKESTADIQLSKKWTAHHGKQHALQKK
jgi:hypothetical protein